MERLLGSHSNLPESAVVVNRYWRDQRVGPGRSSKKLAHPDLASPLSGMQCSATSEFRPQEGNRRVRDHRLRIENAFLQPLLIMVHCSFLCLCSNCLGRTLEFCVFRRFSASIKGQSAAGDSRFLLTSWTFQWSSLALKPFPKMTCFVLG